MEKYYHNKLNYTFYGNSCGLYARHKFVYQVNNGIVCTPTSTIYLLTNDMDLTVIVVVNVILPKYSLLVAFPFIFWHKYAHKIKK